MKTAPGSATTNALTPPGPRHHLRQPARAIKVLAVGLALRFIAEMLSGGLATGVALLGFAVALVFVALNLHLPGTIVIGVGVALNAVVMGANGAMPVHADAAVAAGVIERADLGHAEWRGPRRLVEDGDRLLALGDRIPLRFAHRVVSFGDLILFAGLADLGFDLARRARRQARPRADA